MLFASCAKDGETGPQGPAGSNGNANVSSISFTVDPVEWVMWDTPGSIDHAVYFDKSISLLTPDVISNGLVVGYLVFSTYSYLQLPHIDFTSVSNTTVYQCVSGEQIFRVIIRNSTFTTPVITDPVEYKVVIVPQSARIMNADLDWNNYLMVADRFDLD